MKKAVWLVLPLCLLLSWFAVGVAEEYVEILLDEIGVATAFPAEWTVVTPDTVAEHFMFFAEDTPEQAADALRSEGVHAVAFSPEADVMLRVIADPGDEDVAVYYDIDRYTPAMRTAIRNHFLDKDAWAATGHRYAEAEWTNRSSQGRLLNLTYSIRQNGEVLARGMQVYTIRNGMTFTLDMQAQARQLTSAERRIFTTFVAQTALPISMNTPLIPVGIALTGIVPEETDVAEITVRGQTMPGAMVTAWLSPYEGELIDAGEVKAAASGVFRLDITLPEEGEYRLQLTAAHEGYADSEETRWVSYDDKRIPVNFTSMPQGDVLDAQIVVSGKTVRGVAIECAEDGVVKSFVTGANGEFSFKLDRAAVGDRTVDLSLTKDGYAPRTITLTFNRQWRMDDHIKYLAGRVQALSYANLTANPPKYVDRLVRYTGQVINVSESEDRHYVQLALKKNRDGTWTDQIIAVADGMEITLVPGDTAALYVRITGESYTFSDLSEEGDELDVELPSVELLAYQLAN